jgi:large subunit ribosomal protein L23
MALFKDDKKVKNSAKKLSDKTDKKSSMKDLYGSTAGTSKDASKKEKVVRRQHSSAYKVLVKPMVTEKASILVAQNKYAFEVSLAANKIEIAKAIEAVYGVKPESINIIPIRGKNIRYGKTKGKRKNRKKALVTLPEGKAIKVYEGV